MPEFCSQRNPVRSRPTLRRESLYTDENLRACDVPIRALVDAIYVVNTPSRRRISLNLVIDAGLSHLSRPHESLDRRRPRANALIVLEVHECLAPAL